jgi:hypothetical protein
MHDCVRAREGVGRWPITASILGGSLFCADSLRACCFQPPPNRVCVRVDDWRGFVAKNTISPPRQRRRAHPLSSIAHVAVDVVIVALWDVLPECSRATSLHGAPPGRLGKRVGASGGGWLSVAPSFCAHAFAQLAHVPSRRPSPPLLHALLIVSGALTDGQPRAAGPSGRQNNVVSGMTRHSGQQST